MRLHRHFVALLLACAAVRAVADPGHEIRIEDLNRQITENPNLPDLYYQRAINLREVPRLEEARADLEKAIALSPAFLPAERELAQMDATAGKITEGIARLQKAIAGAPADAAFHLPYCYAVLADLLLRENKDTDALAAAQKGIDISTDITIDLYLFRAEAQRRLGKHDDRVRDLAAAREKLKSYLLQVMWVEALIDAGRTAEALPVIERELETSRLKASWLIRRARARQHDQKTAEASTDLDQALAEIETRLRPERPDLSLLCDRALIHALQGKKEEAKAELAEAKSQGAVPWMTRNAEAALAK